MEYKFNLDRWEENERDLEFVIDSIKGYIENLKEIQEFEEIQDLENILNNVVNKKQGYRSEIQNFIINLLEYFIYSKSDFRNYIFQDKEELESVIRITGLDI